MPPVVAAVSAAAGAFTAAATAAAGTSLGGVFLATTASGVGLTAVGQLVVGASLSALSRALLQPELEQGGPVGTKVSLQFGEDQPQSRIFGLFATAGDLVYHNSWGDEGDTPNEYYVQVIELADFPASLSRLWINGEWAELGSPVAGEEDRGRPVKGYWSGGHPRLYVRFHDGTQTTADEYLLAKFGNDPDRPWKSDMVGYGIPYLILTAGASEANRQRPEATVELQAHHYDRRRDSTAPGGSGSQRWDDWSTWRPSVNPVVMIDAVLRGLRDPITGEFVWGGQDIPDVLGLPASVWIAAMNECDRKIGGEEQYRAGYEVRVDQEPAAVVLELLKACQGVIANVAGAWHVRAGGPAPAVYSFTDDDLIVTSPEEFQPFPGLNAAYNGVGARYPEPRQGWSTRDAPPRRNAGFLAEDGGRDNAANLTFGAVPYRRQVQRLMSSALKDSRRFRRHSFSLPPEARPLTPLDEVTWTSLSNGYEAKDWSLPLVRDLPDGNCGVGLQERDPSDYDWDQVDELPDDPDPPARPERPTQGPSFSVEPATIKDDAGGPRRPAIRLSWVVRRQVTGIRYRVRLKSTGALLPPATDGLSPRPDNTTARGTLTARGEPLTARGEAISWSRITDVDAGEFLISAGVLPKTTYEVQAIYEPVKGRHWSDWLDVTTPDVRIREDDLEDTIRDKIDESRDYAEQAADQAREALDKANEVSEELGSISEGALEDLQEIIEGLQGLDAGTVNEIRGIAVAGARKGWAADPYFDSWTSGSPTKWTATGPAYMSRVTDGFYPAALLAAIPAGASVAARLMAASSVPGQLPGADPQAEWVAACIMLRAVSGSLASAAVRIEWRNPATNAWVAGRALGQAAFGGSLVTAGFVVDSTRMQSKEIAWQRPGGFAADAMRIVCDLKTTATTQALTARLDYLDVRGLSEAEINGFLAGGDISAAIDAFAVTITGPGGALAAQATTLRAEFGAADAVVSSTVVALSNDVEAIAGRVDAIQSTFGGNNLILNGSFEDGARAAGVAPMGWTSWSSQLSVVARGSSSNTAVQAIPSRFAARLEGADATQRRVRGHDPVKVKPGATLRGSLMAAASGSGTISIRIGVMFRFFGPDRVTEAATAITRSMQLTNQSWQVSDFEPVTVPAGVAYFETWVVRISGGSLHALLFTGVESFIADDVAMAAASRAMTTATTASSAVATMQDRVEASFDDWDAFVEETATAVATAEKAESAYVIRAAAGAGSAGLRIVAWDDESGPGGAVVVDARYLIAPGTISAGEMVITDLGLNMAPDDQLQSVTSWQQGNGFDIVQTAANNAADSVGMVRWQQQAGAGTYTCVGRYFPVRAGNLLTCSFQVDQSNSSAGQYTARARLRFFDKSGSYLSGSLIGEVVTSDTDLKSRTGKITVPAGAFQARWMWEIEKPGTAAAVVRFYAPECIRKSKGSVLITPDGAFMEELTAQTAWIVKANIVDAEIVTAKIAGNAVTTSAAARSSSSVSFNASGFTTVQSLSITSPSGATRRVTFYGLTNRPSSGADLGIFQLQLRRRLDGGAWSELLLPDPMTYSNRAEFMPPPIILYYLDEANGAGTYEYEVRARSLDMSGVTGGVNTCRLKERQISVDLFKR